MSTVTWVGLALLPLTPPTWGSSVQNTIDSGGCQRTFALHAPPGLPSGAALPLVLVLHGGGGTGPGIEASTGFSKLADRYRFIVAYPDAVNHIWNDGRGDPQSSSQAAGVDDVAFIASLVSLVSRGHRIDAHRIFVTGMSNGGFMSQLLAARLSDRIAAIAAVAGGMGPAVAASLQPAEPVSVLMMNGTADRLVPYAGGPVLRTRGETISVEEIVRKWVAANHCPSSPVIDQLQHLDPSDRTHVTVTAYQNCARRTAVVLYRIDGGGHTWPGGSSVLPHAIVGQATKDINASDEIWRFFADHPRP